MKGASLGPGDALFHLCWCLQGRVARLPFPDPMPRMSRLSVFLGFLLFFPVAVNIARSQVPSLRSMIYKQKTQAISHGVFSSHEIPGPSESFFPPFPFLWLSVTLFVECPVVLGAQEQGSAESPASSPELPPPLAAHCPVYHLLCSTTPRGLCSWEGITLSRR